MNRNNRQSDQAPTYRTTHDFCDHGALSTTILNAVSEALDCDPIDLPPLHETVDADALDSLFGADSRRAPDTDLFLSLSYAGCDVTVAGDGSVFVFLPNDHE